MANPTSMASTRWVNSIMTLVWAGGITWPFGPSGQAGMLSPDPLRRTIPPQTIRMKTRTTVAMKRPGSRLDLSGISLSG